MRKQILISILSAVIIAVLLLGVPLAAFAVNQLWDSARADVDATAKQYALALDRTSLTGHYVTDVTVASWLWPGRSADTRVEVTTQDGRDLSFGTRPVFPLISRVETATGATLTVISSSDNARSRSVVFVLVTLSGVGAAVLVGAFIALRSSRRISAPLIYLSAQAEQLGSGGVRPRVTPSGIEEIDLVQDELVRASENLAGRIAAERQFASDVSHQLRTPLTALSMRLEEIQMISSEPEVQQEAEQCLDQLERLTGVVEDLKRNSQNAGGGTTQAINVDEFLVHQQNEWEGQFRAANRPLVFRNETDRPALATPGSLGQVIATLLENSLKYGAGTTTVRAKMSGNKKGMYFEVSDEGEGVDDEIAPDIFKKGVSGHGSTGIGLALAKQLIEADGGKLDLIVRRPPTFQAFVATVPASLDPNKVLPQGAIISVSHPKRRF